MGTHALIIGKDKAGKYRYGQTHYDGYNNLNWLQTNMFDINKVEEFLFYLTEGGDDNEGHGISSLGYETYWKNDKIIIEENKPIINWSKYSYNCGISNSLSNIINMVRSGQFDHPCYVSYWDGEKWENIEI